MTSELLVCVSMQLINPTVIESEDREKKFLMCKVKLKVIAKINAFLKLMERKLIKNLCSVIFPL